MKGPGACTQEAHELCSVCGRMGSWSVHDMTVSKVENVSVMLLLELETNLREIYTYYGSFYFNYFNGFYIHSDQS